MKKNKLILILTIAILLYGLKHIAHYSPLWINIVTDLCAMPFFLTLLTICMQWLYGSNFQIPFRLAMLSTVVISILFEYVFPMLSSTAVADITDVFLYFGGLLVFSVFLQNQDQENSTSFNHVD